MQKKSILISGAGVAGPTLAYWLLKYGFVPTIVEKAPSFREGGYIIDFWGLGFDIAERMKILPALRSRGYFAEEIRIVDNNGKKVGGFSFNVFKSALGDRFLSITRGDLAATIFETISDKVEFIFDDSINSIREGTSNVFVTFEKSESRKFDLVIGADGLHSTVRRLVFGLEAQFEKQLGYYAAAFSTTDYKDRDENVYVCHSAPGKQIARFALRDNRTVFYLIFADCPGAHALRTNNAESTKIAVEKIFADVGWETPIILERMSECNDLYCDAVSQIRMGTWHMGRVGLVGDAAYCPSLLAGQGAALAMLGSYVLAGELSRADGNYTVAFERYENLLGCLIRQKQKGAERMGSWFAPRTSLGILARNQFTRLLNIPFVSKRVLNSSIADKLLLPDY